ncbi:MAG: heme-binding protein [Dehalococcoidia bacterium]
MELTYEDATRALNAALAKAQEIGVGLSVAVVDAAGNPVALARMTGARRGTTSFACQGKAMVAAIWGVPSADVAARMGAGGPIAEHAQSLYGHRLLFLGGGLPLKSGDEVVGAIAASGGTGEQDLQVATAGVEAFDRG